jgi:hypothetical protein
MIGTIHTSYKHHNTKERGELTDTSHHCFTVSCRCKCSLNAWHSQTIHSNNPSLGSLTPFDFVHFAHIMNCTLFSSFIILVSKALSLLFIKTYHTHTRVYIYIYAATTYLSIRIYHSHYHSQASTVTYHKINLTMLYYLLYPHKPPCILYYTIH